MKYIINTINLKIGGAHQRAVSFLKELRDIYCVSDWYHVFLTAATSEQIDINDYPENIVFHNFEHSPAAIRHHKKIVARLDRLEMEIEPDSIFSFVGPAYWRPKRPHIVGFGIPHIVYDDYGYVKKMPLTIRAEMAYKKTWTKYEADYFVVQTDDVKERLAKKLKIRESRIFVVSNGIGSQYKEAVPKNNANNPKKLLLFSGYRTNKNFEIINRVIKVLKTINYRIEFHVTMDARDYKKMFEFNQDWVINHGHVLAKDGPDLYNECDAMFLPSHLECFSASYPEAMKMERPILTSNLSFAHTVCGDAALYFDNNNEREIADKIISIFEDKDVYEQLVKKGKIKVLEYLNSTQQALAYLNIMTNIAKKTDADNENNNY